MDFVAVLIAGGVGFVLGFAARKFFTKRDPVAVAAVDAAAKKFGDRL